MKNKRIIIVGHSNSGKNHLADRFISRGFKFSVSHTTREKRPNELDGESYYFISKQNFEKMIKNNEIYEWMYYANNYYGTSIEEFYNSDLFVMEPVGINNLKKEDRMNSFIIFINIDENIRMERMQKKGEFRNDTSERIRKDKEKFRIFNDYDLEITNPNF